LVERKLIDRFGFNPLSLVTIEDLVNAGIAKLEELVVEALVALDDFIDVPINADAIVNSGLLSRAQLEAKNLIDQSNNVSLHALVNSGLVFLEQLIGRNLIDIDDLNLPNVTLGELLATPITDISELVKKGIAKVTDLLIESLDARQLIESGLVSLAALAEEKLVEFTDLDQRRIDLQKLLAQDALGAPTRIYLGHGDGTFEAGVNLSSDLFVTRSIALGDVDHDGKIDIVVGNAGAASRFYKNLSPTIPTDPVSVSFAPGVAITESGLLTQILLRDMNKDTHLDLVAANLNGPNKLYLGNGDGTFGPGSNISSDASGTLGIAAGDIDTDVDADNDGKIEEEELAANEVSVDLVAANAKIVVAAGAASLFSVGGDVQAYVAGDARVVTPLSLRVDAHDETRIVAIARSDASSTGVAHGVAAASPNISRNVAAHVDGSTGEGLNGPQLVIVEATAHDDLLGYAAGSASAEEVGLSASIVAFRMNSNVEAYIGQGAALPQTAPSSVRAFDVQVLANHRTDVLGLAGSFAGSPFTGIGAAAHADIFFPKRVSAHIDSGAIVQAGNNVVIEAVAEEFFHSLIASQSISDNAPMSIAASVALVFYEKFTHAYIGNAVGVAESLGADGAPLGGAVVRANGNILLRAASDAVFDPLAGALALSLGNDAGASVTFFKKTEDTRAYISNSALVDALASRPEAVVIERSANGGQTARSLRGISITATSHADAHPIAVGGAFGGGQGAAGSVTATLFDTKTLAYIDGGAKVNLNRASASAAQLVRLFAWDDTEVLNLAGALSESLWRGVGASIDRVRLTKTTEAFIGADAEVESNTDVDIKAVSDEDITSFPITVAVGLSQGIAAQIAAMLLEPTTRAYVTARATVRANRNVLIWADNRSEVDLIVGGTALGLELGLGVSGGIIQTDKVTEAFIGDNAQVDADAHGESIAPTGTFDISHVPNFLDPFELAAPVIANPSALDAVLLLQRVATPIMVPTRGVSVVATARDDFETISTARAGALMFSLDISGAVILPDDRGNITSAHISGGAKVNTDTPSAHPDQIVRVAAGMDEYALHLTDAQSEAVLATASFGVALINYKNTTTAYVNGAVVLAKKDVVIQATATEDVLQISTGVAPRRSLVAGAGAGAVLLINNHTAAHISGLLPDSHAPPPDPKADPNDPPTALSTLVQAEGNVLLLARDDTDSDAFAGSKSIGGFAVNLSVSLTLENITKETQAFISGGAVVNARGNLAPINVPTGQRDILGFEVTRPIHGLGIVAINHDDIFAVAVGSGGPTLIGIAGSATLHQLDETTKASISSGIDGTGALVGEITRINPINLDVSENQVVYLLALNETDILGFAGGLTKTGSTALGLGGSLDGGQLKKRTEAGVERGADVKSNGDVEIRALSDEDVTALAGNAGLGDATAIIGAADVYQLLITTYAFVSRGAIVEAQGSVVINADDRSEIDYIAGMVASTGLAIGASGGFALMEKDTRAFVDEGARVTALGSRPAIASNSGQFVTDYSLGVRTVPGLVGLLVVEVLGFVFDNPIRTFIQSAFDLDGNEPWMRLIDITPVSAPPEDADLVFVREVSPAVRMVQGLTVTATNRDDVSTLIVGFGATNSVLAAEFSAAGLITSNETRAYIGNNAIVNETNTGAGANQLVLVAAGADTFFSAVAGGAALSGENPSLGSVGGAFGIALLDNLTEAWVGPGAIIDCRGDVLVLAQATEDLFAFVAGVAVARDPSLVTANGSMIYFSVKSATHAYIGLSSSAAPATVRADGNILVSALDDTDVDVIAGSAALGKNAIGAGLSLTMVKISKDTQAFIGRGAVVNAKGNSPGMLEVYDGSTVPGFGREQIHGVAVLARSNEEVFSVAAASTFTPFLGVSGAITIAIVDSDSFAFVDENARINIDPTGANSAQSVYISAANRTVTFGLPVNVTAFCFT
jgi:hypothetical protein